METLDPFVISSVYRSGEKEAGVIVLRLTGSKELGYESVKVLSAQVLNPEAEIFFSTLKGFKANMYLLSGRKAQGDLKNSLHDSAKAYGLESVKIAKPLKEEDGKDALESLKGQNYIGDELLKGWERLEAQLTRESSPKQPEAMAFLQAIIQIEQDLGQPEDFEDSLSSFDSPIDDYGSRPYSNTPYGRFYGRDMPN